MFGIFFAGIYYASAMNEFWRENGVIMPRAGVKI
jgi:hypothetical protein